MTVEGCKFDTRNTLTVSQKFDIAETLPTMFSVAATGIAVSVIHATAELPPAQYGVIGQLARIGGIGGIFALSL